jgi:hypothetical protein
MVVLELFYAYLEVVNVGVGQVGEPSDSSNESG